MSKRILTIVLEIHDHEQAKAIWDNHLDGKLLNGCVIKSISSGDVVKAFGEVEEAIHKKDVNAAIDRFYKSQMIKG